MYFQGVLVGKWQVQRIRYYIFGSHRWESPPTIEMWEFDATGVFKLNSKEQVGRYNHNSKTNELLIDSELYTIDCQSWNEIYLHSCAHHNSPEGEHILLFVIKRLSSEKK